MKKSTFMTINAIIVVIGAAVTALLYFNTSGDPKEILRTVPFYFVLGLLALDFVLVIHTYFKRDRESQASGEIPQYRSRLFTDAGRLDPPPEETDQPER